MRSFHLKWLPCALRRHFELTGRMTNNNESLSAKDALAAEEKKKLTIIIRAKPSHKIAFILGLFVGVFVLRHQVVMYASDFALTKLRGYEYDSENDCVQDRKKNGALDRCRPLIDCQMCASVTQIDVIEAENMDEDIFAQKYAYSGRPLLVKNATNRWKAMKHFTFEFFRDLYEDLQSPVLYNEDSDCQFFAWDFKEFANLQEVFDLPRSRWQMAAGYKPWYIGWANCDEEAGHVLREYYDTPFFLPPDSESGKRDWIFMGTPGFGAPLHLDHVKYPSWQAQILGTKMWVLRPPPECYWTCHGEVSVVMEPGDIIVVNTNWWLHSTQVLEGLSITITNEYV